MSATVYIVCSGEHGAGHSPVVVYETYSEAEAYVRRAAKLEQPPEEIGHGRWRLRLDEVDELWIYRMTTKSTVIAHPKRTNNIQPRGICAGCSRERALCGDGAVISHRKPQDLLTYEDRQLAVAPECVGSGIPPREVPA